MFKEALKSIVDGTDGGIAGLLMDFEGIPVESYTREGLTFDIESVGAEVSVVVKAIQRAALEDLMKTPGVNAATARAVYEFFHERG